MKLNSKMLSVAAATILVASMTGCESTSTSAAQSTTGATAQHITNPKGSVTGTVQDTNGNPLSGVKVYLAGKETTTDAGGVYNFADVPVTSVGATGTQTGQAVSITIAAPEGYVGATVTVTPMAQIDNAENGSTNAVETFVDGFMASAGTAVLPQTNSTVTGTLRDNTTGELIASQEVTFEFINGGSANTTAQEQTQNGVNTSYAVSKYTITTDASGKFSFASLPTDSSFKVLIPGYTTNSINTNNTTTFTSNAEDIIALGNVKATAITALDNINPYVDSVDNTIAVNAGRATLDDDTRKSFVVNFSETLDASKLELAGNSVLLYTGDATNGLSADTGATATIDTKNKTITVTTSKTLTDGDLVDILFLNADVQDTAANNLDLSATIAFDSTVNNYTKLELKIFEEANTNATQVSAATQLTKDNLGVDDDEAIQAKSNAFNDVLDETAGFQQLNTADDDDNTNGIDAQERLNALAVALGANSVNVSKSRISFTPSNAYQYKISVEDKAGNAKNQSNVTNVANATTSNVTVDNDFGGTNTATISVSDANSVEVYLSNVAPSDVVTITPIDSLNYVGTAATITLADNVAPTTILQKSYFAGNATSGEDSSNTVVQFGDGGELADANGALTIGTPYLVINNSLLDNEDGNGETVSTGVNPNKKLTTELYNLSVVDENGTKKIYLDGQKAYDAQAVAAFNVDAKLSRKMGVAFSEDLATTGTPVFNGSTSITNYTINNDVTKNVNGSTVNADLIDMDVANVMSLANSDNLKTITYTGVTDSAGNAATSATNAVVVVKDEMAPIVLKATYTEATGDVVITFNEPIKLTDSAAAPAVNSKVAFGGVTATYNSNATSNQWSLDATKKVLTIPQAAFIGAINKRSNWTDATYAYYTNNEYGLGVTTDVNHLVLDYSAISDTQDNSWDSYATKTTTRAVEAPNFAVAEIPTVFGANTPTFGTTNTISNTQEVKWIFSQPIRIDNGSDIFNGVTPTASGDYILDGNTPADLTKIQAAFEGVIDPSNANTSDPLTNNAGDPTTLTLSADMKTLTLRFRTTTDLTSTNGDIIRLNTKSIVSDGDTDQVLSNNGVTATAN